MAHLIMKNNEIIDTRIGNMPLWSYGVEADSYEEAYELARAEFKNDLDNAIMHYTNIIKGIERK